MIPIESAMDAVIGLARLAHPLDNAERIVSIHFGGFGVRRVEFWIEQSTRTGRRTRSLLVCGYIAVTATHSILLLLSDYYRCSLYAVVSMHFGGARSPFQKC
jgi:hypothetical protein